MRAVAEAFLKYSPRVHFREGDARRSEGTCWVFIDIASTSHLFARATDLVHGEEGLMRSAMSLARDLGFGVQCAVADTPSGAQAFATSHHEIIIPPGEERDRLKSLSLPHLLQLEGLQSWAKPSVVESIITFFMMLGFKTADDLSRFTLASLQERWGETGALFWKRLNAQDRQVVSPLLPTEPLVDYVHLDFPVSLVSLLLHQMEKSVDFLFARLQGRRYFASKLVLTLHCEYSKTQHRIDVEPNTASRDRDLFLTLLESRLGEINLENPIRDFEVQVVPVAEKTRQLDFFEPRTTDNDRMLTLFSLLMQSAVKPGFYQIKPSVFPEGGWQLATSLEQPRKDTEQRKTKCGLSLLSPQHYSVAEHRPEYEGECGTAIASQPHYGEAVMRAPRPTRILREPVPLSLDELQRLKILSSNPLERLETGWWEADEDQKQPKRDYYFAISSEGQCLWIFQDLRTEEYFLHGYFD
jgi:protein ImuB